MEAVEELWSEVACPREWACLLASRGKGVAVDELVTAQVQERLLKKVLETAGKSRLA